MLPTSILPAEVADEIQEVDFGTVKTLPPAGGMTFGQLPDGRLVNIRRVRPEYEAANPWPAGGIALVKRDRIVDKSIGLAGGGHPSHIVETVYEATFATDADYQRAKTHEAYLTARQARRRNPRPQLVDALGGHRALAARPAELIHTAPEPTDRLLGALSKSPRAVLVPAKEPKRGPEQIIRLLSWKGIALAVDGSGLLYATALRGIPAGLQALIEDAAPLLAAHIAGKPLRCSLPGHDGKERAPAAVSLALGGAPICADHADGRLGY